MNQEIPAGHSQTAVDQLTAMRHSVVQFKALVDGLPPERRSLEHNQQFNELRAETRALLQTPFTHKIPRAITGDLNRDRTLSLVVVFGVILTLLGLGVNSVILESLLVNSLGCLVSSGGMLLIIGAFGVMVARNVRERVTDAGELSYRCDLLLYQLDHRLAMLGAAPAAQIPAATTTTTDLADYAPAPPPPAIAPPEADI